MIQDQINLCGSIQSLRLRCYACNTIGHLINNCSMIHFNPDKEKVLKTFDFSHAQERTNFLRGNRKANFKKFQPHKLKKLISTMNLTNIDEDSASEEEESFDDISNQQDQVSSQLSEKSIEYGQNSNSEHNNPSQSFETKNNSNFVLLGLNEKPSEKSSKKFVFPNQNPNLEPKISSILIKNKNIVLSDLHEKVNERKPSLVQKEFSVDKTKISLMPIRRSSNRSSIDIREKPSIKRPSFPEETSSMKPKISFSAEVTQIFKRNSNTKNDQIILFDDNTMKNSQNSPLNSCINAVKNKNDDTSHLPSKTNEESYLILRDSIEDFDKVHNYKYYFPDFNFKEIKPIYNEKNPWLRMHKRMKIELQRLNQYTFRAIFMHEKLKEQKFVEKKRRKLITKNFKFREKNFVKKGNLTLEESNNFMPYAKQSTISPYKKNESSVDDGNKKLMFTDLVLMMVQKQKEKKKKVSWLLFEWMIKRIKMLFKTFCNLII